MEMLSPPLSKTKPIPSPAQAAEDRLLLCLGLISKDKRDRKETVVVGLTLGQLENALIALRDDVYFGGDLS
jgi:hypothetical protein